MRNEKVILPLFIELKRRKDNKEFVIDKTGVKTVEIIGAKIEGLNPDKPLLIFNGRSTPVSYVKAETEWYDSQSLSVNEIGQKAKIWNSIADKDGNINSNYGYLVYNENNCNQFENVVKELLKNPFSRRATMIYNRPTMHIDAFKNGMSDFVCTYAHQFLIRDNKLLSVVMMRSSDAIYGFFNDFAWFAIIQQRLLKALNEKGCKYEQGVMTFISSSFHVYERHFDMLDNICTTDI